MGDAPDIDDVIASDQAVEGHRAPVNVYPPQPGKICRLRDQVFRDLFKVLQLPGQLPDQAARVGMHDPPIQEGGGKVCDRAIASPTLADEQRACPDARNPGATRSVSA